MNFAKMSVNGHQTLAAAYKGEDAPAVNLSSRLENLSNTIDYFDNCNARFQSLLAALEGPIPDTNPASSGRVVPTVDCHNTRMDNLLQALSEKADHYAFLVQRLAENL